jgi:lysophospholipase L1-like esterase
MINRRKPVKKQKLRILFIGNSHTYFNDMPQMVARRFLEEGYDCEVTMIAHGGWYLEQHVQEPDVRFNILYGHYDYVVLQEHSHPFGPEEKFLNAVRALNRWIREAGSTPVIYMTWAKKNEEQEQARMTAVHKSVAKDIDALLAPVGEYWWDYMRSWPNIEMYYEDGAHASEQGSDFAAKYIWDAIETDLHRKLQAEKCSRN